VAKVKRRCYPALNGSEILPRNDVGYGAYHPYGRSYGCESLQAVALGLRQLQGNEWVEGIARGLNTVKVSVKNVQAEHMVTMDEFTKWLERRGGTPAEMTRKRKVREILRLLRPF